jgi:hypothetical protein
MSILKEYKSSLKSFDVEEIIDLIIFRPLSFLLVKIIYSTNITPNQISIISMFFGLLAGVIIGFGKYEFVLAGAVLIFLSNLLDCADGQLARLKKNGTKIGRLIDGFIDYVTGLSAFLGLGFAVSYITGDYVYGWIIAFVGGFSRVLQNMFFDYYRNLYFKYVYNKLSDINLEIVEFTEEKDRLEKNKGHLLEKFLVSLYLKYCSLQKNTTMHVHMNISPDIYKAKNKLLLRLWSWIGSTTHLSMLIIFLFINKPEYYLLLTIILGNFVFLILLLIQKRITKKLMSKEYNFAN